jgi:hypothetical protein
MKNYLLAFIAAFMFAVAAVVMWINGVGSRAAVSAIGAVSFLLAGIHWRRKGNSRDQNSP